MWKTAGTSIHIFPAVDATHGRKYKSLLTQCLELVLVYLVVKRKKEKSFFKNSWQVSSSITHAKERTTKKLKNQKINMPV